MMKHHNITPITSDVQASTDYADHEKTYSGFLIFAKWSTIMVVAVLIAMAFGFFIGGFFSATFLFILICIASWFVF